MIKNVIANLVVYLAKIYPEGKVTYHNDAVYVTLDTQTIVLSISSAVNEIVYGEEITRRIKFLS